MSEPTPNQPSLANDLTGAPRVGSDEFFYDIFGVNLKGLKSIWTLIVSPSEYFAAARLPDWGGDHWPSVRIWIGLMGILAALQFLWASESSEMTAMFQTLAMSVAEGVQAGASRDGIGISLENLDRKDLGRRAFKLWAIIYPFFFVVMMCALAFVFRPWKPAASFVIRLRFIFAIVVPASVYGLVATLALINVKGQLFQIISFAQLGIVLLIYGVTAYRGPFESHERGERLGLSFVTAILILVSVLVAQLTSMLVAIVPTGIEIIETLHPQIEAIKAMDTHGGPGK